MKTFYARFWMLIAGIIFFCEVSRPPARAQSLTESNLVSISFDQNLNAQINGDLPFRDENGRSVRLRDYLGQKPIVLVLGYYQCPMLCTLTLNGLVQTMEDMKWGVGKEFQIIDVSIDPHETSALALAKKRTYLKQYGRSGADAGWHFLTGDESAIQQLTSEVGFHYAYDSASKQYAHPSGLVILTPAGKVSHYIFGVTYDAKTLFESLQDASGDKVGSPIRRLVLLCFHYSPLTGKYGATVMLIVRVLALATVFGLVWLITATVRNEKRRRALLEKSVVAAPPNITPLA